MFSLKVFFAFTIVVSSVVTFTGSSVATLTESVDTEIPQENNKVRSKRFLFNLFNPFRMGFNGLPNEDEQVQILQRQQRVLARYF